MRDYHVDKRYNTTRASIWPVVVLIVMAYLFAELDWNRIFGVIS